MLEPVVCAAGPQPVRNVAPATVNAVMPLSLRKSRREHARPNAPKFFSMMRASKKVVLPLPHDATGRDSFSSPLQPNARKLRALIN